jgi:hypothetical protein
LPCRYCVYPRGQPKWRYIPDNPAN